MEPWERAVAHIAALATGNRADPSWRVTPHFHPDRLVGGVPILERMARDGRYRSQFETGVSNGGLTAHPGGERWRWESRLFGGAYDEAAPAHRPKYGSLNFRGRKAGGSPRFGSAHLRLARHTMSRTTFSYPDSVFEPTSFGVEEHLSELVAIAEADGKDLLEDYIEAQVHGEVDLARDVEALVLDPSYRGTEIETAARKLGPVEWHDGFRITAEELLRQPDYRGPAFTALGAELAEDGRLDPRILGKAAGHDEQDRKRVWHLLARFGNQELS
ncbi:DUF3626 domain-containing protein [Amycolatopsis sp. AA4]|uniref:DUF3626 domain-containing protein n=1 Tax=Actinomycetes TaxID=1760 RepID=UPI0001B55B77|nr:MULTISPECIES: DUF3626 domain-containing protein [Actinomycetes]ATY13630.1 DUF3626 domain-containing protein [Amycolatopsis sp. AA4]